MSYTRSRSPLALGLTAGEVESALNTAISGGSAVTKLLTDPNAKKIIGLVNEAYQIETKSGGVSKGGSALGDLVLPLEVYVQTKKMPWLKWVIPVAILGIPFFVGWKVGRR